MILFYFVIKAVPEPDPARFVAIPLSPMQKDEQLYTEEDIKHNLKFIDTKLLLTGLVVATGIALHNFPEGMAVYMSTMKQYRAGLAIALAIGLHNVPEGIAVAVSMYAATRNKWEALKWSFLSGLCEPIGAIAFGLLFYGWIPETVIYGLLGGVAGLMVYICSFELITTALNYSGAQLTVISNVIGIIGLFLSNVALSYLELEH
jgi:ZIP family zinc transporter